MMRSMGLRWRWHRCWNEQVFEPDERAFVSNRGRFPVSHQHDHDYIIIADRTIDGILV